MDRETAVSEAKNSLGETVDRVAYGGDKVFLTKHGKRVAVLISVEEYERLKAAVIPEEKPYDWYDMTSENSDIQINVALTESEAQAIVTGRIKTIKDPKAPGYWGICGVRVLRAFKLSALGAEPVEVPTAEALPKLR